MKNTKAFIMDFDIATRWENYFTRSHLHGTLSVRICSLDLGVKSLFHRAPALLCRAWLSKH